jgi:3-hydroxyanthranilate 3,4-dioxygenase
MDIDFKTIPFDSWIEANRSALKPPVGNKVLWPNREFIVMVVGGPNQRADFHINQGEELFYQIHGDIELRVLQGRKIETISIKQGDMYLLAPRVPHSPQRPAGTVGLVVERKRHPKEMDAFVWYCEQCCHSLYSESIHLTNIETQLPPIFDRFYSDPKHLLCSQCGHVSRGRNA